METALVKKPHDDEVKCPELKMIRGGDEAQGICKLINKWCLKESGYPCEEYERIMEEECI